MTSTAWIDIVADLDAAVEAARRAAQKAAGLGELGGDFRDDREIAIGKLVHDAYSAAEKALERLVELVDGGVPTGGSYHRDLIRRAERPVDGVRPAIISPDTGAELRELVGFRHVFRHVYDAFDYDKAAAQVGRAATVIPRLRDEIAEFAAGLGLAPRA